MSNVSLCLTMYNNPLFYVLNHNSLHFGTVFKKVLNYTRSMEPKQREKCVVLFGGLKKQ